MVVPTKIGPYTLVKELGRGGMAQVWLARRIWPDGKRMSCVIKFPLKMAALNPAMLRQFEQEAELSMLIQHDNIVHVFDTGNHEGLPYIVMAYVAGCNLLELLLGASNAGQQWDINTAVHIIREVGYALVHAHEMTTDGRAQRVVHRDVASKNVMINLSGGVLLADFGVATSVAVRTTHNHIKGTLPYMAPEHYLGNACPASDAFGLGAIFWELLEGRPFRGDVPKQELTAAIVEGIIPPLQREVPDVVRKVVEGLLNPDVLARARLPDILVDLEDFPNRRLQLRRMMTHLSGGGVQASGLSNVHFAASPELVQTLAAVKAAGVPLSEIRRPPIAAPRGAEIPSDFVFEASPRTVDIEPPSVNAGLDDARAEDAALIEQPSRVVPSTAVIESSRPSPSEVPRQQPEVIQTVRFEREKPRKVNTLVVTERVPPPSVVTHTPQPVETDRTPQPQYVAPKTERTKRPEHPPKPWVGPVPVASDVPVAGRIQSLSPPLAPTFSEEPEQTDAHAAGVSMPLVPIDVRPRRSWIGVTAVIVVLLGAGLTATMVLRWSQSTSAHSNTELSAVEPMPLAPAEVEHSFAHEEDGAPLAPTGGSSEVELEPPPIEDEYAGSAVPLLVADLGSQDPDPSAMPSAAPSQSTVAAEPEPVPEPDPEPIAVAPPADDTPRTEPPSSPEPVAEQPEPPAKPKAKPQYARVMIKRGFVNHAEIKIAGGKAHVVPGRGAVELKVRSGRRKVRWRTQPDGAWESTMLSFEPDAVHSCLLGASGPRITTKPGQGGAR